MTNSDACPFQPGQKLRAKNRPGELLEFIRVARKVGANAYIEIKSPNGRTSLVLMHTVEPVDTIDQDPRKQLESLMFGQIGDLKRLISYEKLQGTLHEIIYSMEAAQIDFKPYQFKPVLKFINSPTNKLILADEVGLGKTIESGLIWMEVQARYHARRLLVVCPSTLQNKWEIELKEKFFVDAQIADFRLLEKKIDDFERNRKSQEFALVCSYSAIRPSKADVHLLVGQELEEEEKPSKRYSLFEKLRDWNDHEDYPFDLVIFDEAHYMRNTATNAYMLGEILSACSRGTLFVSATPIHNKSDDLHALLQLIDPEFFGTKKKFSKLMDDNAPTVRAALSLSASPVDVNLLQRSVELMDYNRYLRNTPLFEQFKMLCKEIALNPENKDLVASAQDFAEKLNLIGSYFNRTMRKQIEENRPEREVFVYTVQYNQLERSFYNNIKSFIVSRCSTDNNLLAKFALINQQLIAASSLPAYAGRLRKKLLDEDYSFFEILDSSEEIKQLSPDDLKDLIDGVPDPAALARHDSKFDKLLEILDMNRGESIVIFAYFHDTLNYLHERISAAGYKVGLIHGGCSQEERWETIDLFRTGEISILLSSEVGSEGIDLQFSHTLVNYDMPWNPMRVEQRIGRIDRVGQQARKLKIINFNVDDTIEQRVYRALHAKLTLYAHIFGDIEDVLGREIREMTLDLFSQDLTPEQQERRILRTERVLMQKLKDIELLTNNSHELIGLSDYIQRKISEDREKKRYISAQEIEDYFKNFFGNHFKDTVILSDNPEKGCLCVHLSDSARASLDNYFFQEKIQGYHLLKGDVLKISFDRDAWDKLRWRRKQSVCYVNHLSPLIRWITSYYREREYSMCRTAALQTNLPSLGAGRFIFSVNLWKFDGLLARKQLAYSVYDIERKRLLSRSESELVFNDVLETASNWTYMGNIAREDLAQYIRIIDDDIWRQFDRETENMTAENSTQVNFRKQSILNKSNAKIAASRKAIETLMNRGRAKRYIDMHYKKIDSINESTRKQLQTLEERTHLLPENIYVAMGIFYNVPTS